VTNQETLEQAQLIKKVVNTVNRYGLRLPTLVALEAGHPITFLSSQFLWIAQPALSLFMPANNVQQLANLLEEPSAVQALIEALDRYQG
jgi:hypothetical protein